jgi:hypothetical protein
MENPLNELISFFTGGSSPIIKGPQGYISQGVDASYKPKASIMDYIRKPTEAIGGLLSNILPSATITGTGSGEVDPRIKTMQEQGNQEVAQAQARLEQIRREQQLGNSYVNAAPTDNSNNSWAMAGRSESNPYYSDLINLLGPKLAEEFNRVLRWDKPEGGYGGENWGYNPQATNYNESNKTTDYGLFQINDATFYDLMRRRPDLVGSIGAQTPEDLLDPTKNILFAKAVYQDRLDWGQDVNPYGAWYGADPTLSR